jgi:hypothetical protein
MSNEDRRTRHLDACLAVVLARLDPEEGAIFETYARSARSREPGAHEEALVRLVSEYVELQVRRHPADDPEETRAYVRDALERSPGYQSVLALLREGAVQG